MAQGRKPLPDNVRELRGNSRRPPPAPQVEAPTVTAADVKPPSWLDGVAKRWFCDVRRDLEELGILAECDRTALAMTAAAFSQYRKANEVLRQKGSTYTTTGTKGQTIEKPRPEVAIASDSWRRVQAGLAEFGLTPSARTRVKTKPKKKESAFDAFKGRGRGNRGDAG